MATALGQTRWPGINPRQPQEGYRVSLTEDSRSLIALDITQVDTRAIQGRLEVEVMTVARSIVLSILQGLSWKDLTAELAFMVRACGLQHLPTEALAMCFGCRPLLLDGKVTLEAVPTLQYTLMTQN